MGNTIRLCLFQLADHQGPILPSLSGSSNTSSGTLSDDDADTATPRKKPPLPPPPQQQQQQRRLISSKFLQSFKKTRRSFKARKRNIYHDDGVDDVHDAVCYDYYEYHYDVEEEDRERGLDSPVWQRTILMGERCAPPEFSGVILYDAEGNRVPEYPRSPLHKKYWSPSIRTPQHHQS